EPLWTEETWLGGKEAAMLCFAFKNPNGLVRDFLYADARADWSMSHGDFEMGAISPSESPVVTTGYYRDGFFEAAAATHEINWGNFGHDYYHLEVYAGDDLYCEGPLVYEDTSVPWTGTTITATVSNLIAGQTYRWRVKG